MQISLWVVCQREAMRVGMLVSVLVADAVLGGRPQASSVLVGDLHYIGQHISH